MSKLTDDFLRWIYESVIVEVKFKPYRGMDDRGDSEPVTFVSEHDGEKTVDASEIVKGDIYFDPRYDGLVHLGQFHESRIRKQVEMRNKNKRLFDEREELKARIAEIDKTLGDR